LFLEFVGDAVDILTREVYIFSLFIEIELSVHLRHEDAGRLHLILLHLFLVILLVVFLAFSECELLVLLGESIFAAVKANVVFSGLALSL
jgi:hypothetical protein